MGEAYPFFEYSSVGGEGGSGAVGNQCFDAVFGELDDEGVGFVVECGEEGSVGSEAFEAHHGAFFY